MRSFLSLSLAPLAAAAALWAAPAAALNWRIAPAESQITFAYTENGEPAEGRFKRFGGVGEFDRARPQRARLDLEIAVDSIELSNGFRTSFVKTETWFDAESHPTAHFILDEIRLDPSAGEPEVGETARYAVVGRLRIKGVERPVETAIDLTLDARRARAVGAVTFERSAFGVGDRIGGLFVDLSDAITVQFDIVANRL
ncbi:MAG: YceI family protein [Pseudomonadota bacterium]